MGWRSPVLVGSPSGRAPGRVPTSRMAGDQVALVPGARRSPGRRLVADGGDGTGPPRALECHVVPPDLADGGGVVRVRRSGCPWLLSVGISACWPAVSAHRRPLSMSTKPLGHECQRVPELGGGSAGDCCGGRRARHPQIGQRRPVRRSGAGRDRRGGRWRSRRRPPGAGRRSPLPARPASVARRRCSGGPAGRRRPRRHGGSRSRAPPQLLPSCVGSGLTLEAPGPHQRPGCEVGGRSAQARVVDRVARPSGRAGCVACSAHMLR